MGPWHLLYPAYNAVTVRDVAAALQPEVIALAPLAPDALGSPAWQDTPEIALPLALVPWARRAGVPLAPLGVPHDATAEEDFRRYLGAYPAMQATLRSLDAELEPLRELLSRPLDLGRIIGEVAPLARADHDRREEAFGDGPGTLWLRERSRVVAERTAALRAERVALLAPVEQLSLLTEALAAAPGVELIQPSPVAVTPDARERSLLDFAFRGDAPDPAALLRQLREVDGAEARFHEANLLLANGHLAEALDLLETASRGDFSEPYFLPGYLLARLGQLRDLAGQREHALRAYRGVQALAYAPPDALAAAAAGLARPFEGERPED